MSADRAGGGGGTMSADRAGGGGGTMSADRAGGGGGTMSADRAGGGRRVRSLSSPGHGPTQHRAEHPALGVAGPRQQHRVHRTSLPSIPHFANIKKKSKLVRFRWREKKIICSVVSGNLLYGCIAGVLVPFFPSDAQRRGVSPSLVGGVFAVYAFTQFAFSPLVGKLIPVLGASRVFHLGLATAGVSTVAFGVLDYIADASAFIAACYVVRVIEALGTAAFLTAAYTIVANQFPENINMLIGTSETMCAVGLAAGPAIGGGLFSAGGYGLPFYVLGGTILAVTALSCCVLPWIGGDQQRVQVRQMSRKLVRSPEAWLNVVVLLLVAVAWTALDPGLAPYATGQLGITPAQLGLFFLLASGTYAVLGPVWGKLCDDLPNNYVQMALCLVLAAAGLALITPEPAFHLAPSRSLVALGMTMRELFLGGAFIPTFGNILRAGGEVGLPDNLASQAFVSSVWCSGFSIGNTVGPLLAGVATEAFGFPNTVTALSVTTLLLALPVALQCLRRWRQLRAAAALRDATAPLARLRPSRDPSPSAAAPSERTPLLELAPRRPVPAGDGGQQPSLLPPVYALGGAETPALLHPIPVTP